MTAQNERPQLFRVQNMKRFLSKPTALGVCYGVYCKSEVNKVEIIVVLFLH